MRYWNEDTRQYELLKSTREGMTLQEAIERQELFVSKTEGYFDDEDIASAKLGIEAMKQMEAWRANGGLNPDFKLPGETEERTIEREGKDIRGNYFYEERQK